MSEEDDIAAWEAEALVRASAWIFLFRGAGVAAAGAMVLKVFLDTDRTLTLPYVAMADGWAFLLAGLGALGRRRWAPRMAVVGVLGWGCVLSSPWVECMHDHTMGLSSVGLGPHVLWFPLLPLLFLPEVFALYALMRRPGRDALCPGHPRLAQLLRAGGWRRTGRAVTASSMLALSALSMALILVLAPGLVSA